MSSPRLIGEMCLCVRTNVCASVLGRTERDTSLFFCWANVICKSEAELTEDDVS